MKYHSLIQSTDSHCARVIRLTLLLAACVGMSAAAATRTWDGSSGGNWSTAANWDSNLTPSDGDDLVFPAGALHVTNTNNLSGRMFRSITIAAAGYTLTGNAITVSNGIVATYNSGLSIVSLDLTLGASQSFECQYNIAGLYITGDINLGSYTLTTVGAGELRLGGAIGGTGGITKNGSGTHWLYGTTANSYSGETRVNTGTLMLGKTGSAAVPSGPLIIGDGAGGQYSAVVQEAASYQIGDTVPITINYDGSLALNSYIDTVGSISFDGGAVSTGSGRVNLNGNITVSSSDSGIYGQLNLGSSTRGFDIAGGGNLTVDATVSGTGGITKTGDGFLTLMSSNSYSGTTTVQGGWVEVHDPNSLGATNAGTALQNGTVRLVGVTIAGESLSATSGKLQGIYPSNAWTGPITLSGNITIEVPNANQYLNLAATITGTGGFTKIGPGIVILSGSSANTFSGDTFVNAGVLQLSKSGTVEAISAGSLTIGDGVGGSGADIVFEMAPHQIGNIPVRINDSGLLDLNGNDDFLGALTLDGGRISTGAGLATLTEDVTVLGNTNRAPRFDGRLGLPELRIFDVPNTIFYPDLQMAARVEGVGGIQKLGEGTMLLYVSNSYSGLTLVSEGLLAVYDSHALGATASGTEVSDGAALAVNDNSDVPAEPLTLHGSGFDPYGALDSFVGTNSWAGDITLDTTARIRVMDASDSLFLSGRINGPGGLTKSGTGTLSLTGSASNSYSGTTFVAAGILRLNKTAANGAIPGTLVIGDGSGGAEADVVRIDRMNQIANNAAVTVNSSGLLQLGPGAFDGIGSLSGNGNVDLGDGLLVTGYDDSSTAYSGLIRGLADCELDKTGAGTFALLGNNTYPGWTYVMGGTLLVLGNQSSGNVSVSSGGTLGGSGVVGDIEAIGNLAPGSSAGMLTCGNLDLLGGGDFYVELNGLAPGSGYDQLNVRGATELAAPFLHVTLGFMPAVGDEFVIINNDADDAVTGIFSGLAEGASLTASNATLRITYAGGSGNDVVLTVTNVVPVEPLRFTSASLVGTNLALTWAGGVPLYVLEKKSALDGTSWEPITSPMRYLQTNAPMIDPAAFYRVRGGR